MLAGKFKLLNITRSVMTSHASLSSVLACKMENAKVVPDVICHAPAEILKIAYGGGVKVNPGDTLTPTQARFPPCVFWNANECAFYTLCLTDPDAPSRKEPKFREWHHWLVGNIPGDRVARGDVLSEYIGPGPPKGTGFHRYVFLIYKQCGEIEFTEPVLTDRSDQHRALFSISKFAQKHTLEGPIAGNFFLAKYDCYVDKLYKKLSGN